MSLNKKHILIEIAKLRCRELRKKQTYAEQLLWACLRNNKLGKKFLRQHPIFHDITGVESFFIADFYCHAAHLIIELDGIIHITKLKADNEREKILNYLGLNVLRFSNSEIETKLNEVLSIIKEKIEISYSLNSPNN
jgi:very-short-patch-repair endonuclease